MIDIEVVKSLCENGHIFLTTHARERMKERNIKYNNIVSAVSSGEIIEQYKGAEPYPSCLILGYTDTREPLHIVLSVGNGMIWVITAYWVDTDKWDDDYKTRKAVK